MEQRHKISRWRQSVGEIIESSVRLLIFWETDSEQIGEYLRIIHGLIISWFFLMVFLAHTVFPYLWLQVSLFLFSLLICLQHIVLGGCIFTKVEQKLCKDSVSIVDPILHLFNIPVNKDTTRGITILISTMTVWGLFINLSSRFTSRLVKLQSQQALPQLQNIV